MTPLEKWNHYRQIRDQDMHDYSPYLRSIARGQILEIGVCDGVSTAAFLLGLEDKERTDNPDTWYSMLWSVDINPECGNLYDHDHWKFIHADSRTLPLVWPEETFDVLFIDGDHSYEGLSSDLRRLTPLVKPGGLILAHDVQPSEEWLPRIKAEGWYPVEECRQAWDGFAAEHPTWKSEIKPGMTGLGVMVKSN